MSVSGFIWYQGESDLSGDPSLPDQNRNYTCTQAAMITQWRQEFKVPKAFYAIVQLSTWHPDHAELLPELRDQQLATEDLIPNSNFAWATNADFGAGRNIHPPYKQHPGKRLANAALAINYQRKITWQSPTYASATATGPGEVSVKLNHVGKGLMLKPPFNLRAESNCTGRDAENPRTCAWAELQFDDADKTWVNASVTLSSDTTSMVLTAKPPAGAKSIVASSYGWGAVPMMTVYRADMDGDDGQLPVLTWKRNLTSSPSVLV